MYQYDFVRLPESGQRRAGNDRLTNYPDLVHERARQGWRLVQVLVEQPAIAASDRVLIFERATQEDPPDATN